MLSAAVAFVALSGAAMVNAGAIIGDGNVILGVSDEGHLNVPYTTDSFPGLPAEDPSMTPSGQPIEIVGLRSPDGTITAVEQGILGEGWGVGIRPGPPGTGFDDECGADFGTKTKIKLQSFGSDAAFSTADSEVLCGADEKLSVRHQFQSAKKEPFCRGAYLINVTIENRSCNTVKDVIYRRVMDWDIDPTPFKELVTISGAVSASIYEDASNNGFCSPRPSITCSSRDGSEPPSTSTKPSDHGAQFDLNFGELQAGQSVTFQLIYGYFGGRGGLNLALRCIKQRFGGAAFSYAQDSSSPTQNTFLFAVNGDFNKTRPGLCCMASIPELPSLPVEATSFASGPSSDDDFAAGPASGGELSVAQKVAMNSEA